MNCSQCGAKLESDAVFCTSCGAKIEAPKNVCLKCGAALKDDALFCENCGAKVGEKAIVEEIKKNKKRSPVANTADNKMEIPKVQSARNLSEKAKSAIAIVTVIACLAVFVAPKVYSYSLFKKGCAYYEAEKYSEALPCLQKAADKGNSQAMYLLGLMYWNGCGVTVNNEMALRWCKKAAELGNSDAKSNLEYIEKFVVVTTDKDGSVYYRSNDISRKTILPDGVAEGEAMGIGCYNASIRVVPKGTTLNEYKQKYGERVFSVIEEWEVITPTVSVTSRKIYDASGKLLSNDENCSDSYEIEENMEIDSSTL